VQPCRKDTTPSGQRFKYALGQGKRPFTFEDMMKLKRVSETEVSPDGKSVSRGPRFDSGRLRFARLYLFGQDDYAFSLLKAPTIVT
jgi:hypothetical protein